MKKLFAFFQCEIRATERSRGLFCRFFFFLGFVQFPVRIDAPDPYVLDRTLVTVRLDRPDPLEHGQSGNDLAEDGVLPVEMEAVLRLCAEQRGQGSSVPIGFRR